MGQVGKVHAQWLVANIAWMDFQQLILDNNIQDFVKRRTKHQFHKDLARMGFLVRRNHESCLDFQCNPISKYILQYHYSNVYIVYLGHMVMGCMDF